MHQIRPDHTFIGLRANNGAVSGLFLYNIENHLIYDIPSQQKHLYNIYTTNVQMFYKCFVFTMTHSSILLLYHISYTIENMTYHKIIRNMTRTLRAEC